MGPLNPKWSDLAEINKREIFTIVPLMILIMLVGLYPNILLQLISPTLEGLLISMGGQV